MSLPLTPLSSSSLRQKNRRDSAKKDYDRKEEERTEVWHGIGNITKKSWNILSSAKISSDYCHDSSSPATLTTTPQFLDMIIQLNRRGVRQRFITDITKENIKHCKELAKYVELRHLDGITGNFGIVDRKEYGAASNIYQKYEQQAPAEFIYSNVKGFVEQQWYFFETLWSKAIPAEQRIKEIEEGIPVETTEIIEGTDNILNKAIEGLSLTKETFDNCIDHTCPSSYVLTKQMWNKCIELSNRDVRIRFLTEITLKNIPYCKEIMKVAELRHLDGIKGNFGISDGRDYRATASLEQDKPPTQAIRSTIKTFVDQQQYFFETLWNKALPAKQRFREIEQSAKREFVETIRHSYEIQKLSFDIIKRAEEEILILFSTASAFQRQEKAGALELLKEAVALRGVKIRMLVPIDDDNNNEAIIIAANETRRRLNELGIDIRHIKKEEELYPLQNKLTLLIVDQSVCLTVEQEDGIEEGLEEVIGLATYSNIESTVFAYISIFENLWMHTRMMGQYDSTTIHRHRHKNGIKTRRTMSAR